MANSIVIKPLAKVMIAAAWSDGSISNDEINCLKDLLFQLPEMTASDWAELDIYIDSPIGEAERQRLVSELQLALNNRAEKELALQMIDDLANADGIISDDERTTIEEIKTYIEETNANPLSQMSKLLRGSINRRANAYANAPNRELYLDDFEKNRIFYNISRRLDLEESQINLPEAELRKMSLAGGLMARVAYVDRDVVQDELDSMVKAIQDHWQLDELHSTFVAETAIAQVSKGLDYYRLAREFFIATNIDERIRFLDVLFAVAGGDGVISYEETEEIRAIANLLKLTHKQFINAKMNALNKG